VRGGEYDGVARRKSSGDRYQMREKKEGVVGIGVVR
jgi:hypothetical protein